MRRGRPRSFDIDEVTATLEAMLWTGGYRPMSVEDLAEGAGLSVSSLYAAFGSKQGVLRAALARYESDMCAVLVPLEQGNGGLGDVDAFLRRVSTAIAEAAEPRGCFMVNTMLEAVGNDEIAALTSAYRGRVEAGLLAALRRAAEAGEIPRQGITDRARLLQAALYGVFIAARGGQRDAALAGLRSVRREVTRWGADGSDRRRGPISNKADRGQ